MSEINIYAPAFPSQRRDRSGSPREDLQPGLTKREFFSAMALKGLQMQQPPAQMREFSS